MSNGQNGTARDLHHHGELLHDHDARIKALTDKVGAIETQVSKIQGAWDTIRWVIQIAVPTAAAIGGGVGAAIIYATIK